MTNLEDKKLISTSSHPANRADEIVALERTVKFTKLLPGTIGMLFAAQRPALAVKDWVASAHDRHSLSDQS